MPDNLLTKSAFAAVLGVDRSQPTRWAQRGMPVEADGQVDAVRAALWVRENVDSLQRDRRSIGAQQMGAGERVRWAKMLVTAHVIGCDCAASYTAQLLMPHLPEATVRAVTAEMLRLMRVGSAECLADDVQPPAGCKNWMEAPSFQEQVPCEFEWAEMRDQVAAGKLVKHGA